MPHPLTKLTPNLVVASVERSLAFYRDTLGFTVVSTVPEQAPYVFAIVQSGPVQIFLNAPEPAIAEYPAFKDKPIGGTLTLFIEVTGIDGIWQALEGRVPVAMPIETKWYGMREFAIADPDGYLITFAQRT
jgi:catechol 2,3-dioxygenase-like lactoylglutathione lyase family enzyme